MADWWGWSWLLTLVGVTGFWLAGNKVWWCWYINVACQALWAAYSIVTEQWGFLAACVIYSVTFTRNAIRSTREHRAAVAHERALADPDRPRVG